MTARLPRLRAEVVTAVAATVTAIAAVAIAAWDNVETRRHNRMSVAPRLTIDLVRANDRASVTIRNDGIGPALIDSTSLWFRDDEGEPREAELATIVAAFVEAGHDVESTWVFAAGDAIAVDRSYVLLGARAHPAAEGPGIDELIARLSIAVTYESIYGDTSLATFNR